MLGTTLAEAFPAHHEVRNEILRTLHVDEFAHLRPLLHRVQLTKNQLISDCDRGPDSVQFIESGIVSRLVTTRSDPPVEVAITGRFGFIGTSVVLDSPKSFHRSVVLISGTALRVDADELRSVMHAHPRIKSHLLLYVQILLRLEAQFVLCNARHGIHERLARWLLMALDRLDGDQVEVTHDYIARALGVRRPGVTDALAEFEAAGAIAKQRGGVKVLSRDMLLERTCECYGIATQLFEREKRSSNIYELCCGLEQSTALRSLAEN